MKKKLIGYSIFFIVLVAVFLYFVADGTDLFSRSNLAKRGNVQAFSFTNQNGAVFSNSDMLGKVCVVEYFFTTCKGICPKLNNNMKKIYDEFKNEQDFLIVSHTCNPEIDSVAVLKHYADSLHANARKWAFLTGGKDSLYRMARYSYGVDDPQNTVANIKDDFIHTQFFALVDKNGIVRGPVYDGLKEEEINKLKHDIKELLKERTNKQNFVNGVFTNTP